MVYLVTTRSSNKRKKPVSVYLSDNDYKRFKKSKRRNEILYAKHYTQKQFAKL